jgi:transcriptional regulator with XRE-family HTH domain
MKASATDSIVGRRLRIFRVSKGCDLESLSAALNVAPETIERYENGCERIPPCALRTAAEMLDVSLHAFFDPRHVKVVPPCAATEEPVRPSEPAGDISEVIELLEHFGKVKDRVLRAEILKFVAFLSDMT